MHCKEYRCSNLGNCETLSSLICTCIHIHIWLIKNRFVENLRKLQIPYLPYFLSDFQKCSLFYWKCFTLSIELTLTRTRFPLLNEYGTGCYIYIVFLLMYQMNILTSALCIHDIHEGFYSQIVARLPVQVHCAVVGDLVGEALRREASCLCKNWWWSLLVVVTTIWEYLFRRLNTRPKEGLNGEGRLVGERRDTPSYASKSSWAQRLWTVQSVNLKPNLSELWWKYQNLAERKKPATCSE